MTSKNRLIALRFLKKQKHHLDFAKKLGVEVKMKKKEKQA